MISYTTSGTCSKIINFEIIDGKLHNVSFVGGCPGNLQAIGKLVEGMDAKEAAERLQGIRCGMRPTSCGDQFAKAILENI
jgi:uncharacterized protein (TIGR03905 family)